MYDLSYLDSSVQTASNVLAWTGIAFVLAIIGGILLYFLFVKSDTKVSDGLQKVKDLLDFKVMLIEPILKIIYLILTIFVILDAFSFIAVNFVWFLIMLIGGPILIRVIYEAALMLVMIWKNTKIIAENTTGNKKQNVKDTKEKEEK